MTANKIGVIGKVFGGLLARAREIESRLSDTVERASQRLTQSGERDAAGSRARHRGRRGNACARLGTRPPAVRCERHPGDRGRADPRRARTVRGRLRRRDAAARADRGAPGCAGVRPRRPVGAVSYAAQPGRDGWRRTFTSSSTAPIRSRARRPSTKGRHRHRAARHPRRGRAAGLLLSQARVDIGRCRDVRDRGQRLVRTNHVVFVDSADPANQSVSRQHAHIASEGAGDVRVYDDGSVHGTAVVRSGQTIPVPPGSRGVRLRSGTRSCLAKRGWKSG